VAPASLAKKDLEGSFLAHSQTGVASSGNGLRAASRVATAMSSAIVAALIRPAFRASNDVISGQWITQPAQLALARVEAGNPGGRDRAGAADLRPAPHLRHFQPGGRGVAVHALAADGDEREHDRQVIWPSRRRRRGELAKKPERMDTPTGHRPLASVCELRAEKCA
jgi:hypothetical protein